MTDEQNRLLIEADQRSKSNTHRIDRLEETTESINRIATSVEAIAIKQDYIGHKVDKLDGKVETLESKPGKRYEQLVTNAIWAVIAAVITYILSHSGL